MLYNAPTFISFYFILFLQQCYVSQQTHRVRKRLLEPGSAPGCFFFTPVPVQHPRAARG